MGIRLSGGIGPLRVSASPGRAASGFFGLCWLSVLGMFKVMFWLLYGGYWIMRAVYWEAPRAGYRWWQRRQAERATAA
jgi:hypothetical protein